MAATRLSCTARSSAAEHCGSACSKVRDGTCWRAGALPGARDAAICCSSTWGDDVCARRLSCHSGLSFLRNAPSSDVSLDRSRSHTMRSRRKAARHTSPHAQLAASMKGWAILGAATVSLSLTWSRAPAVPVVMVPPREAARGEALSRSLSSVPWCPSVRGMPYRNNQMKPRFEGGKARGGLGYTGMPFAPSLPSPSGLYSDSSSDTTKATAMPQYEPNIRITRT
jgi:hypothetical protein